MRDMIPAVLACMLAVLALAACGDSARLSSACRTTTGDDVLTALQRAPRHVALPDGTALSSCVARALDDADLQVLGAALTGAADRLARTFAHDRADAFRLGFLIGATERGAAHTGGVAAELVARMRQAAASDGTQSGRAALLRGLAAGRSGG
jgi:hypothetical protein